MYPPPILGRVKNKLNPYRVDTLLNKDPKHGDFYIQNNDPFCGDVPTKKNSKCEDGGISRFKIMTLFPRIFVRTLHQGTHKELDLRGSFIQMSPSLSVW